MKQAVKGLPPCGKLYANKLQFWHDTGRYIRDISWNQLNRPNFRLTSLESELHDDEHDPITRQLQTLVRKTRIGYSGRHVRPRVSELLKRFLSPSELTKYEETLQRDNDSRHVGQNAPGSMPRLTRLEAKQLIDSRSTPKVASSFVRVALQQARAAQVTAHDLIEWAISLPKSQQCTKDAVFNRALQMVEREEMLEKAQRQRARELAQLRIQGQVEYGALQRNDCAEAWPLPHEDISVVVHGKSAASEALSTFTARCMLSYPDRAANIFQQARKASALIAAGVRTELAASPLMRHRFGPVPVRTFTSSSASRTVGEAEQQEATGNTQQRENDNPENMGEDKQDNEQSESVFVSLMDFLKFLVLGAAIGLASEQAYRLATSDPVSRKYALASARRDEEHKKLVDNAVAETGIYERIYALTSDASNKSAAHAADFAPTDSVSPPELKRSESMDSLSSDLDEPITLQSPSTPNTPHPTEELKRLREYRRTLFASVGAPALLKYIRELRNSTSGLRSALAVSVAHIHKLQEDGTNESLATAQMMWPFIRTLWIDCQVELERLEDAQNALLAHLQSLKASVDSIVDNGSKLAETIPGVPEVALMNYELKSYQSDNKADLDAKWKDFIDVYEKQEQGSQNKQKQGDSQGSFSSESYIADLIQVSASRGAFPQSLLSTPRAQSPKSFASSAGSLSSASLDSLQLSLGSNLSQESRRSKAPNSTILSSGFDLDVLLDDSAVSRRVAKSTVLEQSLADPRLFEQTGNHMYAHHEFSYSKPPTKQGWISWGLSKIGLGTPTSPNSPNSPQSPVLPNTVALSRLLLAEQHKMYQADEVLLKELHEVAKLLAAHPERLPQKTWYRVKPEVEYGALANESLHVAAKVSQAKERLLEAIAAGHQVTSQA